MSNKNSVVMPRIRASKFVAISVLVLLFGGAFYFFVAGRDEHKASEDQQESELIGQNVAPPTKEDKAFIKEHETITENYKYKIRRAQDGSYIITLFGIINRPEQYESYLKQLADYKKEALDYLRNADIDVNKVKITYEPEEATDL